MSVGDGDADSWRGRLGGRGWLPRVRDGVVGATLLGDVLVRPWHREGTSVSSPLASGTCQGKLPDSQEGEAWLGDAEMPVWGPSEIFLNPLDP